MFSQAELPQYCLDMSTRLLINACRSTHNVNALPDVVGSAHVRIQSTVMFINAFRSTHVTKALPDAVDAVPIQQTSYMCNAVDTQSGASPLH